MILPGFEIAEKLYESKSTLVFRGRDARNGRSVVLKVLKPEVATMDRLARFRHEFHVLSRLELPGVIKVYGLEKYRDSLVIVLEDIGGASLDRILDRKPMPLGQFLMLAVRLADILGGIHEKRITHKDINPSHIIWNTESEQLRIVGFSIADELPQRNVGLQPPAALEGDLAYISPEQTGRMNRPVDYRTDFYSLGVTFYEMLIGNPPFPADDALACVYSHIARVPEPPSAINPDIPAIVSDIVMRLLAKAAEDRYQSAYGLQADLEHCLSQLTKIGRIERFELAQQDFSASFSIPSKLYGREQEVQELMKAFEQVSRGETELLLVAGYPGIGKTSLVREIYRPITEKRGYFVSGKFDQYMRGIPYAPLIDAFSELVRQILCESSSQIARYKDELIRALGPNGQVVIDVIPEAELIIGRQPPVPSLGLSESQNRFKLVFQDFVRTLATSDHPLVVFLDDLQWADLPSLQLIEAFVTDPSLKYMLIIGAYRDNEVSPVHPLIATRNQVSEVGIRVQTITLGPLEFHHINHLIIDTLRCCGDRSEALAALVLGKTNGNPFFLKQFLNTLYDRAFIWFDVERKAWEWDLEQISAAGFTDNVLDLMASRIRMLSPDLQEVLSLAACIGNQFDLKTLNTVSESSLPVTAARLKKLMREGLVLPLSDHDFRTVIALASMQEPVIPMEEHVPNARLKFLHDRVQQSAYLFLEERQRKPVHLKIGRLMLQNTEPERLEDRVFDIVGHFNTASDIISLPSERSKLTRLNLLAGKRAMRSAAFEPALKYLLSGIALVDENAWEREYGQTLELYTLAAKMASLSGDYEALDRLFMTILHNAATPLDTAGAYEGKIHQYISQGKLQESIDTALEILNRLGLSLPSHPSDDDLMHGMEATKASYAGIPIEDLINLPAMMDKNTLAIMRIASKATAAAYIGRPGLFLMLVFKQVGLSIKYGNAIESPYAYSCYALVLCGKERDIDTGYRFGKLAIALLDRLNDQKFRSKTLEVVNGHVWHFKEHLLTTLPSLEAGYQSGLETGDLEYAGYNAFFYSCNAYFAGVELKSLEGKMASYHDGMRRIHAETGIRWQGPFWQATQNLLGKSPNPCQLIGEGFDQTKMLPLLEETNNKATLAAFYVNTLVLCYLFENNEQAIENAMLAEKYQNGMLAMFSVQVTCFYDSLAHLRLYPGTSQAEQARILERVQGNQQQLKGFADQAPMNHRHKWYLVEAELARVLGNGMGAAEHYDRAIALAKENEYIQEEALGNELAARFWLEKDKADFARLYMTRAYQCYERWGATRKADDLKKCYPRLIASAVGGVAITPDRLDLSTVIKASRTISGEIVLSKLLETVMRIVIENAGAQKGCLLMEKDGRWMIEAGVSVERGVGFPCPVTVEECGEVPASIIYYVARTKERVVLDDAAGAGRFVNDPYISEHKVKSVLCAPLLSRGRLIGILYLENSLLSHAFTPDRVQLLEALLSQAAVSLENAHIYETLRESEEKFRAVAETTTACIIVYRETVLYVNPAGETLWGFPRDQILNRKIWELVHPDFSEIVKDRILKRLQGGAAPFHYEFKIVRKDGEERWVDISTTVFKFEGQPAGIGVLIDTTDRKRAEEELRRHRDRLEELVVERTADLREANAELKQEISERKRVEEALENARAQAELYLDLMGHDINNINQVALGYLELADNLIKSGGKLGMDSIELIEKPIASLNNSSKLIDKVMTLRKLKAREPRRYNMDLCSVLTRIKDRYSHMAGRDITINYNPPAACTVMANELIDEIFINLIENSVKHSREDKPLVIDITQTTVYEDGKDYFRISIGDNGPGISDEVKEKLFARYYRGKTRAKGKGLGLYLVKALVEDFYGKIWVEDRVPGDYTKGVRFVVMLPAVQN